MKKLLFFLALFAGMAAGAQTVSEFQRILAAVGNSQPVTGQATATVGNNALLATAGTGSVDLTSFSATMRSVTIQFITPAASTASIILESSGDGTTWNPVTYSEMNVANPTLSIATISLTASTNRYFQCRPQFRLFRARVSAATGSGTQAITYYSPYESQAPVQTVVQPTAGNLNVTAAIAGSQTLATVTTVGTVTNGNLGTNSLITDVTSAAITTTTTTAAFTPTFGVAYQIVIPVTATSGTNQTLDVSVEESDDNGTNWFKIYDFPRITATGIYRSPRLVLRGTRVRYVQTLTGTTPSFTRAINRIQMSGEADRRISQLIDRTVSLTTLSSTTPSINVQAAESLQLSINIGAATTPPALQLQVSDDNGLTWTNIGSPLNATANSTVSATITNINAQLVRAIVTTAGTGVTAGFVLVKGF